MTGARKELFENIKSVARSFFGPTLTVARPSGRKLEAGNWSIEGRNIPAPWQRREWDKTHNIANLPAVIDSGISGPTKSMYGSRVPFINPELFKTSRPRPFRGQSEIASQRTLHESEVVAMDPKSRGIASSYPRAYPKSRQERLARGIGSDNHTAALDSVRKHPRGSTDVLARNPQPQDFPLRGQNQFPILRSIARRLGV